MGGTQKKNATYKDNLLRLKNLVLMMFEFDTVVVPKESEVRTLWLSSVRW